MVAVACKVWRTSDRIEYNVYTFDLPSRTRLGPLVVPGGKPIRPIWTHDEYLRFATIHPGLIIIWEVEFTLKHPPTQVESFPIPDEVVYGREFLFLPVLYRLAFTTNKTIQVLDVKASKLLLKSAQVYNSYPESFSSDGRFLALTTDAGEVHIWKESPAGYALHQQPPFLLGELESLFLSPKGGSIIFTSGGTINLWHTGDQTLFPPSLLTEGPQLDFLLAFSPDEKSAAFAELYGNVVTILDLRSGDSRLTIDTGMRAESVGVAGGTVIVVEKRKIATWNLHGGDRAFNASINDGVRTVMLDGDSVGLPSLSPDLSRIVTMRGKPQWDYGPGIYDVPTGKCLAMATTLVDYNPRFTRDGREVWTSSCFLTNVPQYEGLEIVEDSVSGTMELIPLEETLYPSRTFFWDSIRGYKVTDDGWVLSPTRKRLLWLPHRWRSDQEDHRIWSGRFLGLSHRISEVVILEFVE